MNDAISINEPVKTAIMAASQGCSVPTLKQIEGVEKKLLQVEQISVPLTNLFAPGIYYREVLMKAGTVVIGHEHKTEHFNIVLSGRASVLIDGVVTEIKAPAVFVSKAGVRKILEIHEDMRWATIHPTTGIENCGQDVEKLEDALRVKSRAYLEHEAKGKLT